MKRSGLVKFSAILSSIILSASFCFFNSSDVNAQAVTQALAIQRTFRTSYNGTWTTSVMSNGPFNFPAQFVASSTSYFALQGFNFSGKVPNSQKGISYSGDATISLSASSAMDGSGFRCGNVVKFYAHPEQGNRVSESSRIVSCNVSNYGTQMDITIHSDGTFSASTTASTFVISLYDSSTGQGIYSSYLSSPTYIKIDSADVNIVLSEDPNTSILGGIEDGINQQNQQDSQDRKDLENQSKDVDASADSSGMQAESTGSTLLQAFTSFVNALTSASAGDCSINFNIMGYINGGQVDLCSLSIPRELQTIATLLLIGFCVPLSIATARKLIGLFRSFQK